ncbi:putative T7SS-secreted protein [Streptomyces sp. NPDC045369]|uniref:putative T7SS-secreted protein n=1 Tax=Streptomyces sp. NPDC045369 TaxID=3155732 RepID=UPI00340222A3
MSDDWSGLGWNPTPGHPNLANNLAGNLSKTAATLKSTYDLLDSLDKESSYWSGEAAKAFTEKISDLPDYLSRAHESLEAAGGEIKKWSDALYDMKVKARNYEEDAKDAREKVKNAEHQYEGARTHPDLKLAGQVFETKAELDSAQHRLDVAQGRMDSASRAVENARAKLQNLIDDAKKLEREHSDTAQNFADQIRKHASDHAPDGGFLDKLGDWWDEHGGDLLTVVATIAGIAAIFVPVLAPIAIGLSLAAAAQHANQYIKSGKDMFPPTSKNISEWATLAGDVLGAVPGVGPAIKGTKAAIGAGRASFGAARGAGAVAKSAATVSQAAKTGAVHFREFAKAADPSNRVMGKPIEWAAQKLGSSRAAAEMTADVTQAVVTGGLAVPTAQTLDIGWTHSDATTDRALRGTEINDGLVGAGMAVDPLKKIFTVAKAL